MSQLPSGTVTFLFTDIEGSTQRWEQYPEQMHDTLAQHDTIVRSAIQEKGGHVFKTIGDAFCAVFPSPHDALGAALELQRDLVAKAWPAEIGELRVRAALHTAVVDAQGSDYFGRPVNRVARLVAIGHGGQTLLSHSTYELVRDSLPSGIGLRDLGEHRLKDLFRPVHIYQLLAPDLRAEFPPIKTLDARPNNLPIQLTPLIGRQKEIEAVGELLRRNSVHLVTLNGPGGTGKTRLSLQVAAEMLDDFSDGVYFVQLAALTDHKLVTSTVAQTLGITEAAGKPIIESLAEHLRHKQLLLLLDNFEQVANAAPELGQLLGAAPHVKVLATSRVKLNVYGEHEYAVPPLSLPDIHEIQSGHLPTPEKLNEFEAVRLFMERARAAKADFAIDLENAPAVAEICVRLDGLPLAIELAAARVKMLPPQSLLARLSNRLELLTGGARDLSTRQQTLRGTIDWSYDLLSGEEQQLLRRMAVFQGGRALRALEEVCNFDGNLQMDPIDGVRSLLDKSLIQQRDGRDGEARFLMLETIHEYAREKLQESGEAGPLQKAHALYFMKLAEEAEPHLTGKKQQEWLDKLEDEYDNIRAALGWASEQGNKEAAEIGLRVAGAAWRYWSVKGLFTEGREHMQRTLSISDAVQQERSLHTLSSRAKALNGAGTLALRQGDCSSARSLSEAALVLAREAEHKPSMSLSLNTLGMVAWELGDYAAARGLHDESLALRRELGDNFGIAASLNNLGLVAQAQGDYAAARALHEEALLLRKSSGEKLGIAMSLNNLALVTQDQGDYATARTLHEQSLTLKRELGDKWGISNSLGHLGLVAQAQGDYKAARALHEESLIMRREIGQTKGVITCLAALGGVAIGVGEVERGARLLGAVEGLLESTGIVLYHEDRLAHERRVKEIRSLLGEEALDKAWREGRAMNMEEAIAYALEEGSKK